jgi:hypothetical protein
MVWYNPSFKTTDVGVKAAVFDSILDAFHIQVGNEIFGENWL